MQISKTTVLVAVVAAAAVATMGGALVGQSEGNPADIPEIRALTGAPAVDGLCTDHAEFTLARPDPDDLTRLVAKKGRNARLHSGALAASTAGRLASQLGGDLVINTGHTAKVRITESNRVFVDTYSRIDTAAGDPVWFLTESLSRCVGPTD